MGTYIYRITAKTHRCSDGQLANIALYAYKPIFGWDEVKANRTLHVRSGAAAADRYADTGKLTGRFILAHKNDLGHLEIEPGAPVFTNPPHVGSFYDTAVGQGVLTKLGDVTAVGTPNMRAQRKVSAVLDAKPALL